MNVLTEGARYAADIVLNGESMEDLPKKFGLRKVTLESKGIKVKKTRLLVTETETNISRSKMDVWQEGNG